MRYLVGLVLMIIGGIHGYIFMETGKVDPCQGAVQRVIQNHINDKNTGLGALMMLNPAFESIAASKMRSEGIETCYWTALTGEDPAVAGSSNGTTTLASERSEVSQSKQPSTLTTERRWQVREGSTTAKTLSEASTFRWFNPDTDEKVLLLTKEAKLDCEWKNGTKGEITLPEGQKLTVSQIALTGKGRLPAVNVTVKVGSEEKSCILIHPDDQRMKLTSADPRP